MSAYFIVLNTIVDFFFFGFALRNGYSFSFSCLARYSGPTVHFVDEHYDTGRILAQRVVPVLADDTADELAARVLHEVVHLNSKTYNYMTFLSNQPK